MTRNKIKEMIMALLGQADYDVAKSFDPETAEESERCEEEMEKLINIAEKYINKKK